MSTGTAIFSSATLLMPPDQTLEVSTAPATWGGPMRAAPFAAEIEPLLVPTSHTGTSARRFTSAMLAAMSCAASSLARKFGSTPPL